MIFFSFTGKGILNELKSNSGAVKLPEAVLPHCESAVSEFVASGGQLTLQSSFGHDPLAQIRDLMLEHNREFQLQYPNG